ncbi:hypothetical protein EDB19DRAFT_503563 [Suillus lakei]|nr:hypothetical protein EDB19DRAFT_503563 [Suillus lakei]
MHASSWEGAAFASISIPLLMVFSQCLTTVPSVIQIVPQRSPTLPTRFSVAMSRTSELISTIPSSALHSTLVPRSTLIICYLKLCQALRHCHSHEKGPADLCQAIELSRHVTLCRRELPSSNSARHPIPTTHYMRTRFLRARGSVAQFAAIPGRKRR